MVFDAARGHMFYTHQRSWIPDVPNHPQSWALVGTTWVPIPAPHVAPDPPQMVYDTRRGRAVRISSRQVYDESGVISWYDTPLTLEWDGAAWIDRAPVTSFSPRGQAAIAYDEARGRVVLFGGTCGTDLESWIAIGDTWEWDGTTWLERSPAISPAPRIGGVMAFDAARGKVVLFGGWDPLGGLFGDTWLWDGSTWTPATPEVSPQPRYLPSMAYSAAEQRIVLFGGASNFDFLSDTWEWDGSSWIERTAPGGPYGRRGAAMAYDPVRERVFLFGGTHYAPPGSPTSLWEWDGLAWQEHPRPLGVAEMIRGDRSAMTYDSARDRVVYMVGQDSDGSQTVPLFTFEWDGRAWEQRFADVTPGSRQRAALAFDEARQRSVYFRGIDRAAPGVADTWEWDGTTWYPVPTTARPSGEVRLAFHGGRGRVLAVGPEGFPGPLGIWEWEGTNWTLLETNNRPQAQTTPGGLAYDAGRDRLVYFGGWTWDPRYGGYPVATKDTWEWDGVAWELRQPAVTPPICLATVLAYDESRARTVARCHRSNASATTWEWDGSNWAETTMGAAPVGAATAAYDRLRGQAVFFEVATGHTWAYAPIDGCGAAVAVREFVPGVGSVDATADALFGAADGQGVTLGTAGTTVVRVSPPIADGPGTDLTIYEVGARDGEVDDPFVVWVSDDGVAFKVVRQCPGGGSCLIDLARTGLSSAEFVRVSDVGPADPLAAPGAGADIDAMVAVHCREACNGVDDDGDGAIDEALTRPTECGIGGCHSTGIETCSNGTWGEDSCVAGQPSAETCNGIDDNCDGLTDNGIGPGNVQVMTDPATLWPPNHRLVDVHATVSLSGGCPSACPDPPVVVLASLDSSEPDDARGFGDGHTTDDIRGATTGSADFDFQLRAERDRGGGGRLYQIGYMASDCFGDTAVGYGAAVVPHDQGVKGASENDVRTSR